MIGRSGNGAPTAPLASEAGRCGGMYVSHMRSESSGLLVLLVLAIGTTLTLLGLGLVQAATVRALVESRHQVHGASTSVA